MTFLDGIDIELFFGYYIGYLKDILKDGLVECYFRILNMEYPQEVSEQDYLKAKEILENIKIEVKEPFRVEIFEVKKHSRNTE